MSSSALAPDGSGREAPFDPTPGLAEVQAATERFLHTIRPLTPEELAAPSLLPDWTRGHVCAHVAGNADSLINLLTSARTGQSIPQYASVESRNAAIEAGATRSPADQLAEVRESAERFASAVASHPADAWGVEVEWRGGARQSIDGVLWARLREVEIHHVDLGLAYAPARWSDDFTGHVIANAVQKFRSLAPAPDFDLHAVDTDTRWQLGSDPAPMVVSGPQAALLAWLIGRSAGDGLTAHAADGSKVALPTPPPWL